jgi:hypothetical protein
MLEKYHDASVSLQVTVSVKANSQADAQKQLEKLSNEEIIMLLNEQISFIDDRFDQTAVH